MRGGAAKRKLGNEGASAFAFVFGFIPQRAVLIQKIRKQQRPELQAFLSVRDNPQLKQKFRLCSAYLARCDKLDLYVDMYFKELI
ncbi:hypothetical protein PSAB_10260 [Paenibacillus sabinae T27]|uniref:Uncharacterized protein n=1 Tax=Paenibacillus sabinae T27 TaxID=1268072 RepID=X4ZHX8_9BACL|nr:hypothetical protein PSAB_10260 [Paenibacillus sabinae T27]